MRLANIALISLILITHSSLARAAAIDVLCSNGIRTVMEAVVPQFERATGHTVRMRYGVSAALSRQIAAGERFDLAVLTESLIDRAIAQGAIVAATRVVLARSAIVLAIRTGAPRVDIGTPDALERTLLASRSVTYALEGAGGVFFTALVQRLGLVEALETRLRPVRTGGEVAASLANGGAELAVLPLSELLSVPGVDVLGPFPAELAGNMVMAAGHSTATAPTEAAIALIDFLMTPAVSSVLEKNGMDRPKP